MKKKYIKKKSFPIVPEEIKSMFTEAPRMHSCALTCQWKSVISQHELWLMRQNHTCFALWDMKKNWWSIWVIFDMFFQFTRGTQNPSFRLAKLYSLLAYVIWIPEMEYFYFKELTCGQALWHQAMSSPLKQHRLAEAHTIFLFYYTCNVSNFAVLWAAKIKEVKRGAADQSIRLSTFIPASCIGKS